MNSFSQSEEPFQPEAPESDRESSSSSSSEENSLLVINEENGEGQNSDMPLPPERSFETIELLKAFVYEWTLQYGYDLTITGSKISAHTIRKTVRCGRAGQTQNSRSLSVQDRVRKTSSRKNGCPVSLSYVFNEKTNQWRIQWPQNPQLHNHSPNGKGQGVAHQRRYQRRTFIKEIEQEIVLHASCGLSTSQSIALIQKKFPSSIQTSKDIQNLKAQVQRVLLSLSSVVDATIKRLDDLDYFYRKLVDAEDRLQCLFFAYPESIWLYQQFYDVVLLDCTYKTNKYNRPLLNIVGITGFNKTLQIGLCLLFGEDEQNFSWALQQLQELLRLYRIPEPSLFLVDRDRACINALAGVFPNSNVRLCTWHLNKDVKAYVRQHLGLHFDEQTNMHVENEPGLEFLNLFEKLQYARTEDVYNEHLSSLRTCWPFGFAYLEREWLHHHRDLLASFVVDEYLHFDIRSTSRVEGSHSQLKKWLKTSQNHLFGFIERTLPWIQKNVRDINEHVSNEHTKA